MLMTWMVLTIDGWMEANRSEESGVGAAASSKAAQGKRGKRTHVEGPQKGGVAAPRSQRHAAVRVDRAASAAKRQKKAAAAAAAVAAGPGAQGKSFRESLKTLHTPDEVIPAPASPPPSLAQSSTCSSRSHAHTFGAGASR